MFRPHYLEQHLHKEFFEDDWKALLPLPFVASDELELKVVRTNGYAKFTLSKRKAHVLCSHSLRPESGLCEIDSARGHRSRQELPREHTAFAALRQPPTREHGLVSISNPTLEAACGIEVHGHLPHAAWGSARVLGYMRLPGQERHPESSDEVERGKAASSKAAEAVRGAVSHGASDVDGVLTVFHRLNYLVQTGATGNCRLSSPEVAE